MILSIHIAAGGLAMILGAVALAVKRAGLPIGAVGCCLSMSSSSWVPVPPFWRFEKVQATDLDADTLPHHMDDGEAQPKERPERKMMTYPDRRSASTSVPYSQTTQMSTAPRLGSVPGAIPRTMSSVR
jgi:hypothetical protein